MVSFVRRSSISSFGFVVQIMNEHENEESDGRDFFEASEGQRDGQKESSNKSFKQQPD